MSLTRVDTSAKLKATGWIFVKMVKTRDTTYQLWRHPDHQCNRELFFTKSEALHHQKLLDKGYSCDCVPSTWQLRSRPLM